MHIHVWIRYPCTVGVVDARVGDTRAVAPNGLHGAHPTIMCTQPHLETLPVLNTRHFHTSPSHQALGMRGSVDRCGYDRPT